MKRGRQGGEGGKSEVRRKKMEGEESGGSGLDIWKTKWTGHERERERESLCTPQ